MGAGRLTFVRTQQLRLRMRYLLVLRVAMTSQLTSRANFIVFLLCHQRASPVSSHRGKNPGVMSFSSDWMPVNMSNSVKLPGPSKARFGENPYAYG